MTYCAIYPLSPPSNGGAINRPFDSLLSDGGNHLALMKLSYQWNGREKERKTRRKGISDAVIMENLRSTFEPKSALVPLIY